MVVYTFTTGEGEPDFTVRSSIDPDTTFHVQRMALVKGSDIFADMFDICSAPEASWEDIGSPSVINRVTDETRMDMPESSDVLQMLFRVLHEAPVPLPSATEMSKWEKLPDYYKEDRIRAGSGPPISTESAVPLPLLRRLFGLADKYALKEELLSTLYSHLVAHAFDQPLQVYALATALEADDVAAFASTQLHSPPLESYSPEQLEILPSVKSLQVLYILHAQRTQALRKIVAEELLFPHGYGKCTSRGHADRAEEAWRKRKRYLLSMGRLTSGTDIAAEMLLAIDDLDACDTCKKAFDRAIGMLQYKSRKIPQSIKKITSSTSVPVETETSDELS
ncbi:hypothetical protein M408DRAFT_329026 [Serendipita vermifera MAFF 305830]|uniref:BTB domain-containing protein n=1 Tax=Serendipita vermifera MAFF 305830 TaxID=933852 RepID=A0A0C2XIT2_SERVB|nr:hypothetical protein M408DRAFT_329026 [Serendipita vermifera MAFF 305830]